MRIIKRIAVVMTYAGSRQDSDFDCLLIRMPTFREGGGSFGKRWIAERQLSPLHKMQFFSGDLGDSFDAFAILDIDNEQC